MIQKLGNAMKKMANRAMMRGNRGDAQAITDFGVVGMRSNLSGKENAQVGHSVSSDFNTSVSSQVGQQVSSNLKAGQAQVATHKSSLQNTNANKKLGNSILDALGE